MVAKILTFLTIMLLPTVVWSHSPTQCPPAQTCPEISKPIEIKDDAYYRERSFGTFMGGLQLINTWVPKKLTGSYTQILNRDFSLELEFATSKKNVDVNGTKIGDIREERYTLFAQYYLTPSFHVSAGPYINKIKAKNFDMDIYGVSAGIGNRWQFENGLTIGIDWLRVNQPTRSSGETRRPAKVLRTIPSVMYFGINIGYSF